MEERTRRQFMKKVAEEPFARLLGIRLIEVDEGYAACEMEYREDMDNIHHMAHGGAVFSLIDEAFEISSNSHGTMAVALSMNVTYLKPATKQTLLRAESREVHCGRKTATYQITVKDAEGLIALCQALVYRKKDTIDFTE
ncbi:MAG TPA: PaaI family thioesterase [Syntrophorhabdaceae bacterium]|jgi:acyl-CoA thioesterase